MPYSGQRGRGSKRRQPETIDQAVELLRFEVIRMFDKGDGREAEWPLIAQILFKTAFSAVDAMPINDAMRSVLRRVEGGLYDRLAGNKDDGLPSPVQVPGVGVDNSGFRPHRTPQPKLKP